MFQKNRESLKDKDKPSANLALDATPADVLAEEENAAIFHVARPVITVLIDKYTRMVMAVHVSLDADG